MGKRRLIDGHWPIYAIATRRAADSDHVDCPFEDFLDEVKSEDQASYDKVLAVLGNATEQGPRRLGNSTCHIIDRDNKIWQFTCKRARILWFYDEDQRQAVICCHAFMKKSQRTPKRDIRKAISEKAQYMEGDRDDL